MLGITSAPDFTVDDFLPVSKEEQKQIDTMSQPTTYWKDAWRRLKKNKIAVAAMIAIILLILFAVVGPMISPYGYSQQSLSSAGLARSGVGESSRISAGNTYSNALNDARSDYNDTVRQSDLAYQQAALTAAENKGKYAADTLLSGTQWAAEYALKQKELEEQVATNQITRAQAQAELDVYKKYAMQQALADLEATRASTKATLSKL